MNIIMSSSLINFGLNFFVVARQESHKYLRRNMSSSTSNQQMLSIPLPAFAPTEAEPLYISFMGRTMSCLLKLTEPQTTIFSLECNGWFLGNGAEVCGSRTFALLDSTIGVCGLTGLERLLSFRILNELQRFMRFYKLAAKSHGALLEQIRDGFFPEWKTPEEDWKLYASAKKKTDKLMMPLVTCLRRVGQAQLLRKMIRNELEKNSQIDTRQLHQLVSLANDNLICQVLNERYSQHKDSFSKVFHEPLKESVENLNRAGDGNPFATVFLVVEPLEGLPVLLALFVISHLEKFTYDQDFGSLVRSKEDSPFDGWPVVAGMASVLKQFHPSFTKSFFSYLSQFIRSGIEHMPSLTKTVKTNDQNISSLLKNAIIFLNQLCSISGISSTVFHDFIPQYLIELSI